MHNFPLKKGWLITIAILLLLVFLNPSYNAFKEFTGLNGSNSAYLHKEVNGIIFSVYKNEEDEKTYAGFCLNFIDITPKQKEIPSPIRSSHDTAVSVDDSFFPKIDSTIKYDGSVNITSSKGILPGETITINEDGLPVLKRMKNRPLLNDSLPCFHRFDDPNNLKGVKVQLTTPCEWPEGHNDTARNEVLKYFYKANEKVISESVVIGGVLSDTSDNDIKMLLSDEGLKEFTKGAGEYVSVGPLMVNDIKGGQVTMRTVKTTDRGTFYFYAIQNYFVVKNRIVLIQYTAISQSDEAAKGCLALFQDLVQRTVFR